MNLSYRGIFYQPASSAVEATETEQTGHFLGKSYKILQGKVAYRQSAVALKYRGIDYNP